MRLIITALGMLFLCLSVNLSAQKSIEKIFESYAKTENAAHILINKSLIQLISTDEADGDFAKDVEGIELIILDENNLIAKSEYKSLFNTFKKHSLDEMIQFRSGDQYFDLLFNIDGDFVKDVILMGRSNEGAILLRMDGRILKNDLDKIDIDFQGSNPLKKLKRV